MLSIITGVYWDTSGGLEDSPGSYIYIPGPPKEVRLMSTCERCLKTGDYGQFATRRLEFHLGPTTIAWEVCADCELELVPKLMPLSRRHTGVWLEQVDLRCALRGGAGGGAQQILKRLEKLRVVADDLHSRMIGIIVSWFRNKRNDKLKEIAEMPKPPEPTLKPEVSGSVSTAFEKPRRRTRKKKEIKNA